MVNIHMGTETRAANLASKTASSNLGPGAYEGDKKFGEDSKTFTIGEKRYEKVVETMGPGLYDPDRADNITRVRSANVHMGSSPSRA